MICNWQILTDIFPGLCTGKLICTTMEKEYSGGINFLVPAPGSRAPSFSRLHSMISPGSTDQSIPLILKLFDINFYLLSLEPKVLLNQSNFKKKKKEISCAAIFLNEVFYFRFYFSTNNLTVLEPMPSFYKNTL